MKTTNDEELLLDSTYRSCYWNPEYKMLRVISKGYVPHNKYIEAVSEVLEVIKQQKPLRILFDVRDYRVVSDENRDWVKKNYIALLEGIGVRYVAGVVGDVFGTMVIKNVFRFLDTTNVQSKSFREVEEATQWLISSEV